MPLDNELLNALKMYSEGVNSLMISRTLSDANQRVAEIKANEDSEQNKRSQMQDLSNQLVRQLGAQGVEPQQIAQQAQAIMPRYSSPGEAAIQGALLGGVQGKSLIDAAKTADIASQAGNMEQVKLASKLTSQRDDKKFAQALILAGNKGKKVTESDLSFDTNVQSALTNLQQLEKTVKKSGNFEVVDTDAQAVLNQAAYDLAIAYSKIVDPATAAREGEVKAAQKYMLPMGLGTRNSVTLASIKQFKNKITERVKARAAAKRAGHMDIYDQHFGGATAPAGTQGDQSGEDDISSFIKD